MLPWPSGTANITTLPERERDGRAYDHDMGMANHQREPAGKSGLV
jgi:hypothetical protein